jgi:superfamily II DNA or RNA helicase
LKAPTIDWAGLDSPLAQHVLALSNANLAAYAANPLLVREHAGIERQTAQGGYGRRQIYELVQNGADELIGTEQGRIQILLTDRYLYCANEGDPLDDDGVDALLSSHISMKRGSEIGRFGLGFKSVLGVTDKPEFYSRTGSLKFDADVSAARIRPFAPDLDRLPVLRVATPLDPRSAGATDPILDQMMTWASTVVRLPRESSTSGWLTQDIADFPAEFLLFSPHVSRLTLEDVTVELKREIRIQPEDGQFRLIEGNHAVTWRVFNTVHVPSELARREAGDLADRKDLPLIWAVPTQGRGARGHFWAFFPTEYETTLSGILNAPWKTNEDRQNLLTGIFNEELIDAAANLVVGSLEGSIDPADPGSFLDILPGRGREAANWADRRITEKTYELASMRPSIPDQLGRLRLPEHLHIHPEGIPRSALDLWSSVPSRPTDWCHPSIETRERRARVNTLREKNIHTGMPASCSQWLKALVGEGTPESSIAAIHVAAMLALDTSKDWRPEIARAPIVLTADERLVQAEPGSVFLPGEYATNPNIPLVHPALVADGSCRQDLEILGIGVVEPTAELEALVTSGVGTWNDVEWDMFWVLARRVGEAAGEIIKGGLTSGNVHVRTRAGSFRPLNGTLLPGRVVSADSPRDRDVTIDLDYHESDRSLLDLLGAVSIPAAGGGSEDEPWFGGYLTDCHARYEILLADWPRRPQTSKLGFSESSFPGPMSPLSFLSEEGRARFTHEVMLIDPTPAAWMFLHETFPDRYPRLPCPAPHLWLLLRHGRMSTSVGVVAIPSAVGPAMRDFGAVMPVADCSPEAAATLGLAMSPDQISRQLWESALSRADVIEDEALLGRLYVAAAEFVVAPPKLWCRAGAERASLKPDEITVVVSDIDREALAAQGTALVVAENELAARQLVERWNLRPADLAVRRELFWAPGGDETPLVDIFPGFRLSLPEAVQNLSLVPCASLRFDTFTASGRRSEDIRYHRDGSRIYWLIGQDDRDLIRRLDKELQLGLAPEDVDDLIRQRDDNALRQRLAAIRALQTQEERLLKVVDRKAIMRKLPESLLRTAEQLLGAIDDRTIARLALAVYGVDTLREFRNEFTLTGLMAPTQWAGSFQARAFVRSVGFPAEFAGFEKGRLDPILEVLGPPDLPDMHSFQQTIANNLRRLLRGEDGLRALLSLPTGAGKTRVAVQAIVDAIQEEQFPSPILWIAQSGELCEQAVQTWSFVWRAKGPRHTLTLSRLWAQNEAVPADEGSQVVVATIDKLLAGCIKDAKYDWLAKATCVVIDEAHESIAPSFTEVLSWLGLDARHDRCPMVGLTATPFRGTSETETKRLVRRYAERRLDREVLGDDPYGMLQEMGVLARVNHRLLEGSTVELSPQELAQLRQTRRLPTEAESRLGADVNRNLRLLESIESVASDTTVLLFATSVDHAQTMAALLRLHEIPAAAISGETEPGARRHYIEEFRAGRLRVLTNFNVLTQGFDAPAVGAVFVARPTFSPNLYQQMIGRGLRGPMNGGKSECLIVNVKDNFYQYKEQLAFNEFEYLWTRA